MDNHKSPATHPTSSSSIIPPNIDTPRACCSYESFISSNVASPNNSSPGFGPTRSAVPVTAKPDSASPRFGLTSSMAFVTQQDQKAPRQASILDQVSRPRGPPKQIYRSSASLLMRYHSQIHQPIAITSLVASEGSNPDVFINRPAPVSIKSEESAKLPQLDTIFRR